MQRVQVQSLVRELGFCMPRAVWCLVTQSCLFVIPWTAVGQAPLSMRSLQVRILEGVAMSSSRGSSQPRDHSMAKKLKQKHKGSLLQMWRSEIQSTSHGARSQGVSKLVPSGNFEGRSVVSFFLASRGCLYPSAHGLLLHLQTASGHLQRKVTSFLCF